MMTSHSVSPSGSMHLKKPLAVSIGEPSGIGPDIILAAFDGRKRDNLPPFFVFGDVSQLRARAKTLGLTIAIQEYPLDEVSCASDGPLAVVPLKNRLSEAPGAPSAANAAGVIEAIERGVEACFDSHAAGLVTAPIAKSVLYESGFSFPGHTEFLAELARRRTDVLPLPVMMIASPLLRTIPVTIHIPLADVPAALTTDAIVQTGRIAASDLQNRFGIVAPRLAISGLNPHAGEDGALGAEDQAIIAPAIAQLVADGIDAFGPLPADTMFHAQARAHYDVALCMYHDQALIPAKALGFDDGVNVTLGLPFIRTSPDHGTAFSLAGTGQARPTSFIAALKMAAQMAANS